MILKTTNPYFSHTYSREFIKHVEDLQLEYTMISGIKIIYIPRVWEDVDDILNEIVFSKFSKAYALIANIQDAESLETENFILTKFGLAYEDSMLINLTVPKVLFKSVVGADGELRNFSEGDLVYVPKLKLMCEIVSAGTKNRAFVDDASTLMLDIVIKPWEDGQYIFGEFFDVFDNMEGKNELASLILNSKNLGRIIPNVSFDCIFVSSDEYLSSIDSPMTPIRFPLVSSDNVLASNDGVVSLDAEDRYEEGIDSLRKRSDENSRYAKNDKIEEEADKFVEILRKKGFE